MDNERRGRAVKFQHLVKPIDWTELEHGERLVKFIATDEGGPDFAIQLHGFVDERGNFYITDEIVRKPEDEK